MESSPKYQDNPYPYPTLLPSPTSHSSNSSTSSSNHSTTNPPPPVPPPPQLPTTPTGQQQQQQQLRHITRSDSSNPYPTTFVQADTSSFKQVVQMLTGTTETAKLASSPTSGKHTHAHANGHPHPHPHPHHHHHQQHHQQPDPNHPRTHNIPPIKSIPKKQNSGFKLYERRNSMKNFKISPLNPVYSPIGSGFSPRKPEILSPSILDFPSLVLSPVTPLIPDPFDRSGSANFSNIAQNGHHSDVAAAAAAEEKAIKEKGFYLHPSPSTTPRDAEPPRLLPLFPVTSPRVTGSSTCASHHAHNKMTI